MSTIPERCLDCPSIKLQRLHIDAHNQEVDELIVDATSDEPEQLASLAMAVMEHITGESVSDKVSLEALAAKARAEDGEVMKMLTDHIQESEQDMADFAKDCLGVLRLRGSRDGRRQVTAGVCMSPRLEDGTDFEAVTVTRKLL